MKSINSIQRPSVALLLSWPEAERAHASFGMRKNLYSRLASVREEQRTGRMTQTLAFPQAMGYFRELRLRRRTYLQSNLLIDTDPQQQDAAPPHVLLVRSSLR